MKKKLLFIIILVAMLFSVVGCASNDENEDDNLSIEELIWYDTMNYIIYYYDYSDSTYKSHEVTEIEQFDVGQYNVTIKTKYLKKGWTQVSEQYMKFTCTAYEDIQEADCKHV